jgi:ClpP class serine protease
VLALDPGLIGATITLAADEPSSITEPTAGRSGSVGIMAIEGPLAQKGQAHLCGFVDGYDWIESRFSGLMSDPDVGAVVMLIDSPGGDVAGLEEAVRRMRAMQKRSGKPVYAYVNELAASAAYWLATIADEITVPVAGRVGSIGCIGAWIDETAALEAEGIDVHVFRDPPGKAAGSAVRPVAELADERTASEVRSAASRFTAAVVKHRGMTERKVRGLDGDVLTGQAAVDAGLADKLGTLEGVMEAAGKAASKAIREAKKGQTKMKNYAKVMALIGLNEDASEEQFESAMERFKPAVKFAAAALELSGKASTELALAHFKALSESHDAALRERADIAVERKKLADSERVKLLTQLIGAGWETPATAWAKDEIGMPMVGRPAPIHMAASLDDLRTRAETLCAQPRAHAGEGLSPAAQTGLSELELARCKAKGIDPEKYLALRADIKARSVRAEG